MRIYDIIKKKRDGFELSDAEIGFWVKGYTDGSIPDYQISALLMAIYFKGLNERETSTLTMEMARSGDMFDLSGINGLKADKHSTGGVGDKTSLVVAPIVSACGVPVAKMSGRGLGHTGGTLDKLESIPGFNISIGKDEFFKIVNQTGIAIIGQTADVAPADKKLYALRDVTATVDNISLIAASIMSKKLASGSDVIILDVKTGSGAFMKTLEDSVALAQAMVKIGNNLGRKVAALITDMDIPLGFGIGNSIEVIEAVQTLCANGPSDLTEVALQLAANILELAGKGSADECYKMAREALDSGKAFEKLCDMVNAQQGDVRFIKDISLFPKAGASLEVVAKSDGFISHMDTEECGMAAVVLGAGRAAKEDTIDYAAGFILRKKTGDSVKKGDVIAEVYASGLDKCNAGAERLLNAITISNTKPEAKPLIYAKVTADKVLYFSNDICAYGGMK